MDRIHSDHVSMYVHHNKDLIMLYQNLGTYQRLRMIPLTQIIFIRRYNYTPAYHIPNLQEYNSGR